MEDDAAIVQAAELIKNIPNEDREGLKDLQNLTLAMGIPGTRLLFQSMVENSKLRGVAKKDALATIDKFSPITEVGCMKIDFFNKTTNSPDIAYLLLDKCSKNHNFGEQLDKIKCHISDTKWQDVIKSISMLIHVGRSVYSQLARMNIDLIKKIYNIQDDAQCAKYLDLQVDMTNTTLFNNDADRLGIFVRFTPEIQD
jgi:hypothetical protein